MSRPPKPGDKKDTGSSSGSTQGNSHFGYTQPGALYDRHGPIPVADALEKDTDSAWALFEESVMRQDNPDSELKAKEADAAANEAQPDFEPTRQGGSDFAATDFGGEFYDSTRASPLKP